MQWEKKGLSGSAVEEEVIVSLCKSGSRLKKGSMSISRVGSIRAKWREMSCVSCAL